MGMERLDQLFEGQLLMLEGVERLAPDPVQQLPEAGRS